MNTRTPEQQAYVDGLRHQLWVEHEKISAAEVAIELIMLALETEMAEHTAREVEVFEHNLSLPSSP